MKNIVKSMYDSLPESMRDTALIRLFGLTKVPLIFFLRPKVLELTEKRCVIKIPLNRRTKNHLNSMYFGVLCAGADCAGGLSAMKQILKSGKNVSLAFKEFNANFLKRAEGDTIFVCEQGEEIKEFVDKVIASGERHHMPVVVKAYCPDINADQAVAEFVLELSLKSK